jgi:tRNA dimethylallyltransferase
VDFLESHHSLTAKEFVELAKKSVDSILSKNKIPILTCGTGFYLRAFLYGMIDFPEISLDVRKKVASMDSSSKWKALGEIDPNRQSQIHEKDEYRIDRALEIALSGWTWDRGSLKGGYIHRKDLEWSGIYLQVDRDELYARINHRSEGMIQSGLLEETKTVLDTYGESCPALNSLGYNFAVENIRGKISLECLKEKFSQSHRNYAKRQITWFKKESILKPHSWSEALSFLKNIES